MIKYFSVRNKARRRWRLTTKPPSPSPWWPLASGSCTLEWERSSSPTCTRNVRTQSHITPRWRKEHPWRSIRGLRPPFTQLLCLINHKKWKCWCLSSLHQDSRIPCGRLRGGRSGQFPEEDVRDDPPLRCCDPAQVALWLQAGGKNCLTALRSSEKHL